MKLTLDILQAAFLCVSIVGAIVAVVTYRSDSNRRRAKWLMSFYEKFYEQPQYKEIRYVLDYKPKEAYEALQRVIESGQADRSAELLVDYLNFFEFVASLWRLRQISLQDVRVLFGYYLKRMKDHDWLLEYVKKEDFESLDQLLEEIQREDQE